ncbi:glycosyltransferase family 2 protein [Pedobacter sp. SYP-B3415]|uniref:glycosyltransferase family 2 protein n=1 Tax=Pedobacter sp. SYP-B3415 TaxID=2496641 RepID=UPI00101DB304|nr:glycosyltransferase family 2 protein [Pedobacter sp. SYP-B3415]
MEINKIVAVLVTNNRLELLKEALAALRQQVYPLHQIIVINNGSTDGTGTWLNTQTDIVVKYQANSGGSGGFYTGIEMASQLGADWIWLMDDDTICKPDTLEKLVEKLLLVDAEVGFIGSKCIWKDEKPHMMNVPAIKPSFNGSVPFNTFDDINVLLIETCSFVSLLISTKAVKEVGLPYKEFFIWGDDQEYTRRISAAGYVGLYCSDSIALHKTGVNYFPDFYNDSVNNLWKHKYGFRNEFFMIKKNKGFAYFIFWLAAKVGYTSLKLIKKRTDNRLRFISVLCSSAWDSIFFNPKIHRI